jgi:hypothetical protein
MDLARAQERRVCVCANGVTLKSVRMRHVNRQQRERRQATKGTNSNTVMHWRCERFAELLVKGSLSKGSEKLLDINGRPR